MESAAQINPVFDDMTAKNVTPLFNYDLTSVEAFIGSWRVEFVNRIFEATGSKKQNYGYTDAIKATRHHKPTDKLLISYLDYLDGQPLLYSDYYKYSYAYINGKKLDERYFRQDLNELNKIYNKIDEQRTDNVDKINVGMSRTAWQRYVLFMMLKLNGLYSDQYDAMFLVKYEGSREYNPATGISKLLRDVLPFKIKEYDISRAYASFTFKELGLAPFDVYEKIEKKQFNTLLNLHSENAKIEYVRNQLRPVYGDRVNEVITDERFNEKGRMFEDMAAHEKRYISLFADANGLTDFVRLHDGVIVLDMVECEHLEFDGIVFKTKEIKNKLQNATVRNWYEITPNGIETSAKQYADFFTQEGYLRITTPEQDEVTIIKNENKVLKRFNFETDTLSFLKNNINELDTAGLENSLVADLPIIKRAFLLLQPHPYTLHRDTRDASFIPFKNGVLKVTATALELLPYDHKSIGFFADCESLNHNFTAIDDDRDLGEFEKLFINAFIGRDISTGAKITQQEKTIISAAYSMFGYMVSNYKDASQMPAIILSDDGADDQTRNGGRGKSLLTEALGKVRLMTARGGGEFDPNYRHNFSELQPEDDIYTLDDVPANFQYDALYTNISGSIKAERKGRSAVTIPFNMTPKFIITTNWAVRYDEKGTSTNRRFAEYKFSNFWNIHNTPRDYFGHTLFTDWNAEEWVAFYHFVAKCLQVFFINGLQRISYDKNADNFRAYFSDDVKLNEFERIFERLRYSEFKVGDFLNLYNAADNALRHERLFHKNNAKKCIDTYIHHHNLPLIYVAQDRKWRNTAEK